MEYREFMEEYDEGIIQDDVQFQAGFKDIERTIKTFGGVFIGGAEGTDKLSKLARKISKLTKSDQEIFVSKSLRSLNTLNGKNCNFNIQLGDIDELLIKCQKLPDLKYKSSIGIILAVKYYSGDDNEKDKILKCIGSINISIIDIVKYIRLLKKYKIIN